MLGALAMSMCGTPALAQSPSKNEDAKKKLEGKRNELLDVQKRTQSLETDVKGLAAERERLNSRLVETADLIKKSEAQLTTIETRLGELDEQQRILKGSLNQRNNQIAKLLSALQRMGRNPPPVLITQREDALEMVRSAMLLSAAFPELGTQAKALTVRLTELVRVMTEIRTQRDQLRTEMTRLTDARTRLAGLMEEKRVTLDQRQSELKSMRTAAADISRNVNDLNELISKLDQAVKDNTGLGAYDEQQKQCGRQPATEHYAEFISADRAELAGGAAGNFQGAAQRCACSRAAGRLQGHGRGRIVAGRRTRKSRPYQAGNRFFRSKWALTDAGAGPPGFGLCRENAVRRPVQGDCARNPARCPSHVTLRWLDRLRWRIS